jgi:hypothetical protein
MRKKELDVFRSSVPGSLFIYSPPPQARSKEQVFLYKYYESMLCVMYHPLSAADSRLCAW